MLLLSWRAIPGQSGQDWDGSSIGNLDLIRVVIGEVRVMDGVFLMAVDLAGN
jgi:hypothetical protein